LAAFAFDEGFPDATGVDLAKEVLVTAGALDDAGTVLETVFAGSDFLIGAFETGLAGLVCLGAGFPAGAFLATDAGFPVGAFLVAGDGLERGVLEIGFFATCFAGSGFLTATFGAGLVGLASLSMGFLAGAFLTAGVGLTDFPEVFRDGEGWDFFFNVAQLVPKSRARKDR
jgi:hypothetical protein